MPAKITGTTLTATQLQPFGTRLRSKITRKHLANIVDRGLFHSALHVAGDVVIDGDLVLDRVKVQVLVVDGDLSVTGRLEDRSDEENESLIFVSGDLCVFDLITYGTLEVHGDLLVRDHAVFLDNACAAHIEGDVRANMILDEYHHVRVGGQVRAPVIVQDSRGRIAAKQKLKSYGFDTAVAGILVREVLDGFADEDEPGGFYVDSVDVRKVAERIRRGKPVLREASGKARTKPTRSRARRR